MPSLISWKGLHLHSGSYPSALYGVGFHKFHPGGGVEEKIPHDNGRAVGAAGLCLFCDDTGLQAQRGAADTVSGLGQKIDAADGGNGGQSFPPETHGGNSGQVLSIAQLGGGVAQKRRPGVFGGHAAAVIGDPQEGHTAVANLQSDLGCAGIDGVFQQLLGNTGRALYHFAGGDQVGNVLG